MEPDKPRARGSIYAISTRAARSSGSLIVPVPVDTVVRVVDEVSHTMQQPRLVGLSASGAEFNRGVNLWTWGLRITLEFRLLRPDQTLIRAQCGPKVRTTIVDWGQGARDLRALLGAIDRQVSSDGRG